MNKTGIAIDVLAIERNAGSSKIPEAPCFLAFTFQGFKKSVNIERNSKNALNDKINIGA
jgi:hypothetical protein